MYKYANAILAGILIGIGNIALISCDNKYIGSLLFSVALLSIIELQLPLYTGRIGKILSKRNPIELLIMLLLNTVGAVTPFAFYQIMPFVDFHKLQEVSIGKSSKGYIGLFFAGVMCNILIHIAVSAKKEMITILCIMCFILCGFEHSIADASYLVIGFPINEWLIVVAGNTVGGIITEILLMKKPKKEVRSYDKG